MSEITYNIIQHVTVLSTNKSGWTKELNLVSWNNAEPKYDIREWSPEHDKMGKGITLSIEELNILIESIDNLKEFNLL